MPSSAKFSRAISFRLPPELNASKLPVSVQACGELGLCAVELRAVDQCKVIAFIDLHPNVVRVHFFQAAVDVGADCRQTAFVEVDRADGADRAIDLADLRHRGLDTNESASRGFDRDGDPITAAASGRFDQLHRTDRATSRLGRRWRTHHWANVSLRFATAGFGHGLVFTARETVCGQPLRSLCDTE